MNRHQLPRTARTIVTGMRSRSHRSRNEAKPAVHQPIAIYLSEYGAAMHSRAFPGLGRHNLLPKTKTKTKTYIKTVHNQLVAIMASRQYGKNMQGDKTHSYMKQTYSCIHSNIQPARKI